MINALSKLEDLAPDSGALERARPLFNARKWRGLGHLWPKIWGECKSRGATYFKVMVNMQEETFYCTCSTTRLPCKHSLALMGIALERPETLAPATDLPDWVETSLEKMMTKKEAALLTHRSEEDQLRLQQLRNKNREKRIGQMQAGILELDRWLKDVLRQGMAGLETQSPAFWEEMATRMVNAKLSGIARRIRQLPAVFEQSDWPSRLLAELSALHLFVQGFQQLDELPNSLEAELLSLGGINLKKEEVLQGKGIRDTWLVLGKVEGAEEQLNFRRTWLIGQKSGRHALILDFAWGDQVYPHEWKTGMQVEGILVFYPGAFPLRAVFREFRQQHIMQSYEIHAQALPDFAKSYAGSLGKNPWLGNFPAFLKAVYPVFENKQWWLADKDQQALAADLSGETAWQVMALSGGGPVMAFGEWDGRHIHVLSLLDDRRIVAL